MNRMRELVSLVALLGLVVPGAAKEFSSAAKGTASAAFLRLPTGARAAALGEAYTAVADEPTALYWNPAALTRCRDRAATFMHAAYLDASTYDYAAYSQRVGERLTLGLSAQYLSYGDIPLTDAAGAQNGNFSPTDLALSAGLGYRAGTDLLDAMNIESVGLSVKLVRSKILATAQTTAVDAGILSAPYFEDRLRLAATVSNLGGTMRFEDRSAPLPLVFKVGGAFQLREDWLVSADAGYPRDNQQYVGAGTEIRWRSDDSWAFALRAGYNSRTAGEVGGLTGVALGLGLAYDGFSIDYALLPFGDLGLTHRIGLTLAFGEAATE